MNIGPPILLCEAIAITAAIAVLFGRSVFKSVLFFLTASLSVAALFALQGATYLFISQLALYGGGIAVVMLFAVVIAGDHNSAGIEKPGLTGFIPPVALLVFLCSRIFREEPTLPEPVEMTASVTGQALAGNYLAAFEFSGVLLVVALVAAVMIAIQKRDAA